MKSILYVGATLMISASIYGFVDYRNTNHRNEFRDMYSEKKGTKVLDGSSTQNETMPSEISNSSEKPGFIKAEIAAGEPAKEKALPEVKRSGSKKDLSKAKVKKSNKRKLNYKSFSRAPLREEVEIVKPAPVKIRSTSE
jgi:hypothetical protein